MNTKKERFRITHLPSLLVDTYKAWNSDDPFRLSAIVAYYAVLSMPALLVILINTVGAIWGNEIVAGKLNNEIAGALGAETAEAIQDIIANSNNENKSILQTIIGIGTLVFGATGVFYQLQISLNRIWEIKIDESAGIKKIVIDRVRSFGFIMVIGFLLLTSFIVTALLSVLTEYLQRVFPDLIVYFSYGLDVVISLTVISALFALMFKFLPDAKIQWRTVWVGGIITSVLFLIGKMLLSLYFSELEPGSTYGAAGSIILVLLWVSYSCLILFFGAEFTWVYAKRYGHGIEASDYASRYIQKTVEVADDSDGTKQVAGKEKLLDED